VSGTRALAASVAFYAADHPRYWSLWNSAVETPWVDDGRVLAQGGVIVCDTSDAECAMRAEAWSAEPRSLSAAKTERGFQFPAQSYVFYLLPPHTPAAAH
jgi:hypothetical protein